MTATSIEWTDFSVNPIRARLGRGDGHYCEKISPGCKHCYASRLQPRFRMPQFQESRGKAKPYFEPKVLFDVLRRKKPTKYFWCDMTDMFGDWVPNEWIAACFGVMAATPWHTHQMLTKRPERMRDWFRWLDAHEQGPYHLILGTAANYLRGERWTKRMEELGFERELDECEPWPLANVWLGTSIENQSSTDRLLALCETPAWIRFVSAEPLLEHVDLGLLFRNELIHWVIVGGESGRSARPLDVAWVRSLVRQCAEAKVACFVKQLGRYPHVELLPRRDGELGIDWERRERPLFRSWPNGTRFGNPLHGKRPELGGRVALFEDKKGGDMSAWPKDLRVRQWPELAT